MESVLIMDGVLCISEIRSALKEVLPANCEHSQDLAEMFQALDLDGSGKIDYTEFCAATLAERASCEADVLWAAFKTFDVHNDDCIKKRRNC